MRKLKTTDYIYTHSGRAILPFDFKPSDIDMRDIAIGLRYIYRYNGQIPITVLRHSIGLSNLCMSSITALLALLHDAPEAYLMDVPVPKKRYMKPSWKKAMSTIESLILHKFNMPLTSWDMRVVTSIDKNLVKYEMNIARRLLPDSQIEYPGAPLRLNTMQVIHEAYMWHKSDDDLIEYYLQTLSALKTDALRARFGQPDFRRVSMVIAHANQFPAFERAYLDLVSDS